MPLSFHFKCIKGLNLSVEALLLSAISFRLPSDSISAAASFRLTPVVRFRFQPLWAVRSTAFTASLPLSDPLCFGILSSASVLGSDYSASVLLFLLFPIPPHSGFLGAPSPLSLPWLSTFSPTWFPMSSFRLLVLSSAVRFLSPFPASLPQLFHRCLPSALASDIVHFRSASFRPRPFRFRLLSLCFFLSASSRFRLTVASSVRPLRFRFLGFPRSLRPGFPCLPSDFSYSALLLVSFRSALLRSRSRSTGDPLSDLSSGAGA